MTAAATPVDADEMRLTYERLGALARAPRNPKLHDADGLDASLRRFGYVAPMILNDGTGCLIAGHGRLDALLARKAAGESTPRRVRVADDGEWLVPVLHVRFDRDDEAEAYLIADNKLNSPLWDDEMLAEILSDVAATDLGLTGVGFTDDELAKLTADALGTGEDDAPPDDFREFDENVSTDFKCPRCNHQWSGKPR
jgi:ParB-like chromosome segregation protein Spo0J